MDYWHTVDRPTRRAQTTRGTRAQQRENTRRAPLRESRRLFTTHGYSTAGLSDTVHAAKVTEGALHHHSDSKTELFRAVLEQAQQKATQTAARTSGCQTFLTTGTHPDIQQTMLIHGPAVPGWNERRTPDEAALPRPLKALRAGPRQTHLHKHPMNP